MADELKDLLERAQTWPKEAQDELVSAGLEIEQQYVRSGPRSQDEHSAARERAWARLERLFVRLRSLNPQLQQRTPEEMRQDGQFVPLRSRSAGNRGRQWE